MAERTIDRVLDSWLKEDIKRLNTHLPKERRTLRKLLLEKEPSVEAVDGSRIVMRKRELEHLQNLVPKELHDELRLPFVFFRRMDLGKSTFTVSGSSVEEFVAGKLIGVVNMDFDEFRKQGRTTYLYRPHIGELIRNFHSLVVIGFGSPSTRI